MPSAAVPNITLAEPTKNEEVLVQEDGLDRRKKCIFHVQLMLKCLLFLHQYLVPKRQFQLFLKKPVCCICLKLKMAMMSVFARRMVLLSY